MAPDPDQVYNCRAILFDKDGTLFDFRKTWLPLLYRAVQRLTENSETRQNQLLRAAGYDPTTDRFVPDGPIAAGNANDIAKSWVRLFSAWADEDMGRAALPRESEIVRSIDRMSSEEGIASNVPVTDLNDLFETLRRADFLLGVATSDSTAAAIGALENEGISHHVSFVVGYDSAVAAKPSADIVYAFARETALIPEKVLVVGDTWHDMTMARAAGSPAVGVLTGALEREELLPFADVVLDSVADLPALLRL